MMRTKTLKSRIKLTEAALVKLKERYERKSRELLEEGAANRPSRRNLVGSP